MMCILKTAPRRRTGLWLAVGCWLAGPAAVHAQNQAPHSWRDTGPRLRAIFDQIRQLGEWDDQQVYITDAIEKFWQRNGWNSEFDRFVKQIAVQIARIPPWQINQRLDVVTTRVQQRYALSDQERDRLKQQIFAQALGIITKNFSAVSSQAEDMIRTRQAGRPFTPEQVARWVRNNRQLRADWLAAFDSLALEVGAQVPEAKKELFQRDYNQVTLRLGELKKKYQSWERGEWSPQEWGLDNDPFHAHLVARNLPGKNAGPHDAAIHYIVVRNVSAWAKYVENFIQQFDLDSSQQTTAWSILEELEARARRIEESKPDLASAPSAKSKDSRNMKTPDTGDPVADIFEELKTRLNQLPTRSQRARALSIPEKPSIPKKRKK